MPINREPRRSDVTALELFNSEELSRRTILRDDILRSTFVTATVAEINAGKVILPAIAGVGYTVEDIDLLCAGAAGGATAIVLVNTEDTPKTLITVNVAQATDGARITSSPLTASVTLGTGYRFATPANKAISIAKTGGTLTGTTSVIVRIEYKVTFS